jgi:hypothetical protein
MTNMTSNPYYESPEEDQGRNERTNDWNKTDIISFLKDQYEDPLNKFDVDNYDKLEKQIEKQGLTYDENSDWRHKQVPELGKTDYEFEAMFGIVPVERADEIEDPDPWEVKFIDETGEVQIHWKNK